MPRPRIKICGLTHPDDALLAAQLGADAVGMVFYPPARRCISIERAKQILAVLPPFVTPVALFVDQPIWTITQTLRALQINHIQLSGEESPDIVAQLRDFHVLKSIKCDRATFEPALKQWREAIAQLQLTNLKGIILESPAPGPGGTGVANDWLYIADCQSRRLFDALPPLRGAGGLAPKSGAVVLATIHPYAVDVSSGVEVTHGRKDPEKLRKFIEAAL